MGLLRKHWLGRIGLFPTLLFTVLALRIVIGLLQQQVPSQGIILWLVLSVVLFVWQVVGTSRAADRALKDRGNVLSLYAAYFVLLIAAMLTLLQLADGVSSKYAIAEETYAVGTMPVLRGEKAVLVMGNLSWDLFAQFEATLAQHPSISEIHFDSTGGYVFVARAMALNILERELDTHVVNKCYSACTIAFLAGRKRTMLKDAELGFHRYKLESDQPGLISVADELDRDRLFFAERGLSRAFIQKVFAAEHSELWKPSRATLVQGGVLVQ